MNIDDPDQEQGENGAVPALTEHSEESQSIRRKKIVLKRRDEVEGVRFSIRYGDELNAAQLAAVEQINGPILVIAGAGTGKTRTLIYRVARMIESGIRPDNILLMTFTRKASAEMLRRAATLVGARAEQVEGGTFHSFANLTLRRYAKLLGYENNFSILDQGDSEDVINFLRGQMGLDAKSRRFPRKQTLGSIISGSVNRVTPIKEIVEEDYPHFRREIEEIERLARAYRDYKQRHNLMDYDDLLVNMALLLERHEDVRKVLADKHRYIMVDEYQDTNRLQHEIVRLLGEKHQNVMAVGDDSQSIYSFRGANFRNIMDFPKTFPGTNVVKLEENYRSTQPILDFANEILRRAVEKYEKHLYTRRVGGDSPMIIATATDQLQSEFIVQMVLELREQGTELSDIAILFRSSFLSFDLEIELNKANIPYVKMGGFKFVETAHVKDLVAHLRVVHNPQDVVSWNRILLLLEGVGPRTSQKVIDLISEGDLRLDERSAEAAPGNDRVASLFRFLGSIQSEEIPVAEKVERLIEYYRPIMKAKYDDYSKREKDIEVFAEIAGRYRSLNSFLADMALEPPTESVVGIESGEEEEKLVLSTIHSSKGLEWNSVFILTALDGRFPTFRAAEDLDDMEEERRLMYVASTRAKNRLLISYPLNLYDREMGMTLTKPSRFIADIPDGIADRFVVEDD
ncbi:MAG: ATP-dependent helicase [Ignavibacteriae bacterium]|nr:ATP-dependent helicase [Ignavibacteriota bacterium]MCB9216443.1 ATP-dependent helicase [Ignavibacteria bacterium]